MDQPVTKPVTNQVVTKNVMFRNACVTWFIKDHPKELWDEKLKYVAYGVETCPTTGREHLQMWASVFKPQRLTGWKKLFPGAHIEEMRGSYEQNDAYCSKASSLTELGVKPNANGCRVDVALFCERLAKGDKLHEVIMDMPVTFVKYNNGLSKLATYYSKPYEHDTVRGYWIWGVSGAGKSHYVMNRFTDIFKKPQNKWFDGYVGQSTIYMEDYDCGKSLSHYMKIWTDKWSCSGEVKGGTVQLQHHHFVVTSNYSIEDMFGPDVELVAAINRRCEKIYFGEVFKGQSDLLK